MPTKKKVGISATFALGLINAGINLGRLIQSIICNEADATYCFEDSALLVMGEMSSGILVACVPTMGPVFFPNRFRPTKTAYKLSRRPFQRDAPAVSSAESAASINRSPYTTLQEGGSELQAIVRAGDANTRKQVPAEQF
ncbi:MAG: hypothetical protein L6R36_008579 [Xanthoria steineri]|nr:MAG: hypothetical protein L6R36_008579 [Xanthoria steineri]